MSRPVGHTQMDRGAETPGTSRSHPSLHDGMKRIGSLLYTQHTQHTQYTRNSSLVMMDANCLAVSGYMCSETWRRVRLPKRPLSSPCLLFGRLGCLLPVSASSLPGRTKHVFLTLGLVQLRWRPQQPAFLHTALYLFPPPSEIHLLWYRTASTQAHAPIC